MNWRIFNQISQLAPKSIAGCSTLVAAVILLVLLPVSVWSVDQFGQPGLWSSTVAAIVCFVSAVAAIIVARALTATPNAVAGVLLSILIRTGGPLLAAVLLPRFFPILEQGRFFAVLLPLYMVTLFVETLVSVSLVEHPKTELTPLDESEKRSGVS